MTRKQKVALARLWWSRCLILTAALVGWCLIQGILAEDRMDGLRWLGWMALLWLVGWTQIRASDYRQ